MSKIPVTIVAGYLGAGKTTLLNRILCADHGMRIGVLVNDFGEINIDSQLLASVEGDTVSLANGCICCTIRDDLTAAVLQLIERPNPPEYILTETSGVSDPAAAAMGFVMSSKLILRVAIDAILTIVDAEHVRSHGHADEKLAMDQIAAADMVIVNKTDLVDAGQKEAVHAWIHEIAPRARVIDSVHGNVPLELVLGIGRHSPERLLDRVKDQVHGHPDAGHDHSADYSSWSWTQSQPLAFQAVYETFKGLPLSVFRGKGLVDLIEVPDRRVVVQMVGNRVTLTRGEPWQGRSQSSQIVLIGSHGGIDPGELQARFDACVAGQSDPAPNPMADAVVQILRSQGS